MSAKTAKNATHTPFDLDPEVIKIDKLFMNIMHDLCDQAINQAANSTEQVFKASTSFLSEPATDLLREFQALYFSSGTISARNADINRNVDHVFDEVQRQIQEGIETICITENERHAQDRLELAHLQKRLESLISMDTNIKKHIVPAIASMQFEDAVRQRLTHIWQVWTATVAAFSSSNFDTELLKDSLENLPTSISEAATFFDMVLHRPPPQAGALPEQVIIF